MTVTTSEDLAIMVARMERNASKDENDSPDPGPESVLQAKIVAHAKSKGWPCLSFRQSKKARGYLEPGWPDLTLCLPNGRVIFIELKGGKGVLKDKQRLMLAMMKILGHEVCIIKSFKRFLEIVECCTCDLSAPSCTRCPVHGKGE